MRRGQASSRRTKVLNGNQPNDSKPKSQDKLFALLRHPLTTLLVGFTLTVFIGGGITRYYEGISESRRQVESRREYAEKFAEAAARMLVHTKIVSDALINQEPDPAIQKKLEKYEESYIAWQTKSILLPTIMAKTTSGLKDSQTPAYAINKSVNALFISLDKCLKYAINSGDKKQYSESLDKCKTGKSLFSDFLVPRGKNFEERLENAKNCVTSLQIALFLYAEMSREELSDGMNNATLLSGCIRQSSGGVVTKRTEEDRTALREALEELLNPP